MFHEKWLVFYQYIKVQGNRVRHETSYFTCTRSAYTTVYRHIFLSVILCLRICLRDCKVLNVSFSKKQKQSKETNGKQKFQKL